MSLSVSICQLRVTQWRWVDGYLCVCACWAHLCTLWFPCVPSNPGHSDRWRIPWCSHSSHSDRCLGSAHTHPRLGRSDTVRGRNKVIILRTATIKEEVIEMKTNKLIFVDLACQTTCNMRRKWNHKLYPGLKMCLSLSIHGSVMSVSCFLTPQNQTSKCHAFLHPNQHNVHCFPNQQQHYSVFSHTHADI